MNGGNAGKVLAHTLTRSLCMLPETREQYPSDQLVDLEMEKQTTIQQSATYLPIPYPLHVLRRLTY